MYNVCAVWYFKNLHCVCVCVCVCTCKYIPARVVGYFREVYMYILQNETFCEDCTHEVATLGTWVWFSINFAKINSTNRSKF